MRKYVLFKNDVVLFSFHLLRCIRESSFQHTDLACSSRLDGSTMCGRVAVSIMSTLLFNAFFFLKSVANNAVLSLIPLPLYLAVIVMCATVIFVRIEQGAVKQSIRNAEHVKSNNEILKKKNEDLVEIQKQLQADEDELTKMYEKWLDDDGMKMQDTKSRIKELTDKINSVLKSQDQHTDLLEDKEAVLDAKEAMLTDLHVQLRQKNTMMKQMKMQIRKLNGTLPEIIEKQPDDDDWAW